MDPPCTIEDCPVASGHHRHRHPLTQLSHIGITCRCGAGQWWLLYGGPLPALISCEGCAGTLNLEQWLSTARAYHTDTLGRT